MAEAGVVAVAAKIGRVKERASVGAELGNPSILHATQDQQHRVCQRKVGGVGSAGETDVSRGIESDAVCAIVHIAAEVGRIDQGGAGRIQLGDERIGATAAVLKRSYSRKVDRGGLASQIDIAERVHRDRVAGLTLVERGGGVCAAAANKAQVDDSGIDDQRLSVVVGGDFEPDLVLPGFQVVSCDQLFAFARLLPYYRLVLLERPLVRAQPQVARRVDGHTV